VPRRARTADKTDETTSATSAEEAKPEAKPEPTTEERRKALLAKLPPKEERPASLIGKLALITGLVGEVKKTGVNKFHGYTYARESDLVEAIRPLMAELGIWLWSSLIWTDNDQVVGHQRVKIGDNAEVDSLTILMVGFSFYDADGNHTDTQVFPGYGDDTGDKGAYKALTGAEKYFLMKTFLVSTGDDPEADNRADDRAAARDAATRVKVEGAPAGRRPARHGGRQDDSPDPQVRVLGEELRKAGHTTTGQAIAALQELTGKVIEIPEGANAGGALQAFIKALTQEEAATIIRQLKARADTGTQPGPAAEIAAQDAAAEAADPAPDTDAGPYA
jgi:hypothetical protein